MSQHWYQRDGTPLYEVPKADGKGNRPTTLKDARKLNLVPSVTTIIAVAAKPGLDKWKSKRLLETAKDYTGMLKDVEYHDKLIGITRERHEKVTTRGSKIHDALEQIFTTGIINEEDEIQQFVTPAAEFIYKQFPDKEWIAEKSFAHFDGFGGKVDLYSKDGTIVLDFKTKDSDYLDKLELYEDYPMQLAAYRVGLDYPMARCYNLFISATKRGELKLKEWTEEELLRGNKMFKCLLDYWQLANNYDSRWLYEYIN